MKPGLKTFFDSMDAFLTEGPGGLQRLREAHPGWDESPARVVLYGHFVRNHIRHGLEKLFPLIQASVTPEQWAELVRDYGATRPGQHYDINRIGEGFPGFLADVTAAQGLAEFIPALARFEWADWSVFVSQEQVPTRAERLTVNPTLTVLQHPFRLVPFIHAKGKGPAPEAGDEMVLLWRHPEQLRTWFIAGNDRVLLVVKMALEGLLPRDVAAATGVAEDVIQQAVAEFTQNGLILAP